MNIKHKDPTVQSGNPYEFCFTGRKVIGNALTNIINSMDLGGTLFLNGEWGSGKTTFLKMWRQSLIDDGYPTVLLNSWETEWAEDPLITVIASIYSACNIEQNKQLITNINGIINRFVRNPLPMTWAVIKTIIEAMSGADLTTFKEEFDNLSKNFFDDAVYSFNDRTTSLNRLKESLEQLAWEVNQSKENDKPLVFIVDELDRCKPDYAVRMLEVLKHFFEVPNIVFVCAIDKKHLEVSIKGFYGSDELNSSEYLRRFYDLEVDLPEPNYQLFCNHLYDYYELGLFFDSKDRVQATPLFHNNGDDFKEFLAALAIRGNMTLRQLDRICAFTKITLQGKNKRMYYYPSLSLFITYLRFFDHSLYQDLNKHNLSAQDLLDRILTRYCDLVDNKDLNDHSSDNNYYSMLSMVCRLVVSYNNDRLTNKENLYDHSTGTTSLTSSLFAKEDLDSVIKWLYTGPTYEYKLEWLFNVLNILNLND